MHQQHDEQRQPTVAKLIEKFDSHQYKEQFLKDMSQTQKINKFGEASQKLPKDVDPTEIFELCENTTKLQCLDCNSVTNISFFYCSCGRNLKYKRIPTTFQKDNCDFHSIPGPSRGPKHGQSGRQNMFFKAKHMLRKAKKKIHPTILSRWKADEEYRKSLGFIDIGDNEIMLCDQIALEKHDYTATKA